MSGESAFHKAMVACRTSVFTGRMCSESAAYRCIKDFEQINGVRFDALNPSHVDCVRGMGPFREGIDLMKAQANILRDAFRDMRIVLTAPPPRY